MDKVTELKERFTKDFEETLKQKGQLQNNLAQVESKLEQLRGAIFALDAVSQPDEEVAKEPTAEAPTNGSGDSPKRRGRKALAAVPAETAVTPTAKSTTEVKN